MKGTGAVCTNNQEKSPNWGMGKKISTYEAKGMWFVEKKTHKRGLGLVWGEFYHLARKVLGR